MITSKQPNDWRELQMMVAEILAQCGFAVEIVTNVTTARGQVELDVYAEEDIKGRKYRIVCECKYWKSNIPQSVIHSFRTVVSDAGYNVGYIITTSDFQSGSIKATDYTNIELLTWDQFQDKFFKSWYLSYFSPEIAKRLNPLLTYSEPILPRWFEKMSDSEQNEYFKLKETFDAFGWLMLGFTPYSAMFGGEQKIPG